MKTGQISARATIGEGRFRATLAYILPSLAVIGGLATGIGPFFGFRIAVVVYFVATLFSPQFSARTTSKMRGRVVVVATVWLIVLLVLVLVRGIVPDSESEILSVSFGLILALSIMMGPLNTTVLRRWTRGWLIAFMVTAAVAIREVSTGAHLSNYYFYNLDLVPWAYTGAIAATLGNPNNYAFFLVASTFILGVGWKLGTGKAERVLYVLSIISVPVLMISTESRIGLTLIILVWCVYLLFWKRRLLLIVIPAVILFLVSLAINPSTALSALGLDDSNGSEISADASLIVRMNLFLNGMRFASESSFIGIGPGAFEYRMSFGGPHPTGGILNPHNAFIELFAQYGLLLTILVTLLLVRLFMISVRSLRIAQGSTFTRFSSLNVALALLALPLLSTTNSTTLDLSFFWAFVGVLLVVGAVLEAEQRPIESERVRRVEGNLANEIRTSTRPSSSRE